MSVSAQDRKAVAERARYCCEYCQSQLKFAADSFSVEHIVPLSRGGSDDLSNLALACQRCNNAKFVAVEAIDPLTVGWQRCLIHGSTRGRNISSGPMISC
jgi:5-methylcytosine-specific restriction endonuclease McrA